MTFLARTVLAFLIAPPFFGLVLLALSLAFPPPLEPMRTILLSAFVGYPLVAILCVPIFLQLTRQGLTGFVTYAVVTVIMAALIVMLIVVAPVVVEERDLATLLAPPLRRDMGLLAAATFLTMPVFWLIARPDR